MKANTKSGRNRVVIWLCLVAIICASMLLIAQHRQTCKQNPRTLTIYGRYPSKRDLLASARISTWKLPTRKLADTSVHGSDALHGFLKGKYCKCLLCKGPSCIHHYPPNVLCASSVCATPDRGKPMSFPRVHSKERRGVIASKTLHDP